MGIAVFPCASVAIQVTVVVPIVNNVPDAGKHDASPIPSTKSFVLGGVYITAIGIAELAETSAWSLITGAVVSTIVTFCSSVTVAESFVTVHVTTVVPTEKPRTGASFVAGVVLPETTGVPRET